MKKILVTIYVIYLDKEYDLLLPIGKKVEDVLDYIQDSLVDLSNSNYQKKDQVLLYLDNGLIINPNNVIKYSGLRNGSKICLI